MYAEHISTLVDLIALGQVIRQGIKAAAQRSEDLENQLKKLSDKDLGNWCRSLREQVFPLWGIPWWSIYSRASIRQLLKAWKNSYVEQAMKDHINLWLDHRDVLQRQACSDLHLEVLQMINMMNFDQDILNSYLCKEEANFNKLKTEKKGQIGMVPHKGQMLHFSYFRFYMLWLQGLHVKENVFEAFNNLNHFLNYLSAHPVKPLKPSIAHTLDILEISMVLLQAMYSCLFPKVKIILPLSYVYLINIWDSLHVRNKDHVHLHTLIEKGLSFSHILRFMSAFVGHMMKKKDNKLNMIQDALSGEEEYIQSGEAERVLVMALVMLVNSGSEHVLDETDKNHLLDALSRVNTSGEVYKYPKRMTEALEELRPVSSSRDVAPILAKLLKARSGEELKTVSWDKTRHRFFWHTEIEVMGNSRFNSIQTRAQTQAKYTRKKRVVEYVPQAPASVSQHGDTAEFMAQAAKEMEANAKKEQAAKTIQRAVKKALFRRHIKRGLRELLKSRVTGYKYHIHLSDYMDASVCRLCDVSFSPPAVEEEHNETEGPEEDEEQHTVHIRHTDTISLQKQHKKTTYHKQNVLEFGLLQEFVNNVMSQWLIKVEEFVENCENAASQCATNVPKEDREELQKVGLLC